MNKIVSRRGLFFPNPSSHIQLLLAIIPFSLSLMAASTLYAQLATLTTLPSRKLSSLSWSKLFDSTLCPPITTPKGNCTLMVYNIISDNFLASFGCLSPSIRPLISSTEVKLESYRLLFRKKKHDSNNTH